MDVESPPFTYIRIIPPSLLAARQLLSDNIAAERAVIANYTKRIDQALEFGDKGLAIRLESMLSDGDRSPGGTGTARTLALFGGRRDTMLGHLNAADTGPARQHDTSGSFGPLPVGSS